MSQTTTKLYSWNVNGIRAVIKKGLWQPFIDEHDPDILCIQETKAKPEQVNLDLHGYHQYWFSAVKPGYSGVALFCKQQPLQVVNGFPDDLIKEYAVTGDAFGNPNDEGRVIAAEFDDFWYLGVYTPNAKDDLGRLELRHKQWDPAFLAYAKQLESTGKPVVFSGDLNVAHTEDDLANPKPNRGKKGFTVEEREGFQNFLDGGFVDTFRIFEQGNGHYTWWSHFAKSRERNVGWRIDYFLVSDSLKNNVRNAKIHADVFGSDHCPVSVTISR